MSRPRHESSRHTPCAVGFGFRTRSVPATLMLIAFLLNPLHATEGNARPPKNEAEMRYWLVNMTHHRFTVKEMSQATGLSEEKLKTSLKQWDITPKSLPERKKDAPLLVLPYPGGRHPRIGFLEGAIDPQRETKVSIFTPWDATSYVVADVPEAIWSNLGLTYLAHTHVPTIWTKQKIELKPLEWTRHKDGTFSMERSLPNGITFGTKVAPTKDAVRMMQWLTNRTKEKLTGMRVQNCVMLKGAKGFTSLTNDNKVLKGAYAACRSDKGDRWIITAWKPVQRAWANAKCPCLHSDPQFPDCPPGGTRHLQGWLSFYEGKDLPKEIERIENLQWWKK